MRSTTFRSAAVSELIVALVLVAAAASAQELEPRAFSPGPKGLNIGAASLGYSTGDLVFDASVPITGATADVSTFGLGYQRFFGIAGKAAKFAVAAAVIHCDANGYVTSQYHQRRFTGVADPRIGLSWMFYGAPALTAREYTQYRPSTIAGVSFAVSPPLGQYDRTKLLNAGLNRWTARAQLGVSRYQGPWTLEGTLGGSFFTDNKQFIPGDSTQSQNPIYSFQAHVAYNIRPQLWVAGSATYYRGGGTAIDDVPRPGFQSNSRYGVTASFPVAKGQSVAVRYSRGLSTRIGSNYDTFTVNWGIRWFDRRQ